jgi:hypothetical protein
MEITNLSKSESDKYENHYHNLSDVDKNQLGDGTMGVAINLSSEVIATFKYKCPGKNKGDNPMYYIHNVSCQHEEIGISGRCPSCNELHKKLFRNKKRTRKDVASKEVKKLQKTVIIQKEKIGTLQKDKYKVVRQLKNERTKLQVCEDYFKNSKNLFDIESSDQEQRFEMSVYIT